MGTRLAGHDTGPRAPGSPPASATGVTAAWLGPSTHQPRGHSVSAAQSGPTGKRSFQPRRPSPPASRPRPRRLPEGAGPPPCPVVRPAAASGPLLLPAPGEGAGGGHIRRVPSPGDGAPGSPRIVALVLRASGHTPQSPGSRPSVGPKESGREPFSSHAPSRLTPSI